jgi:thiamine pyrophosphokinase
MPAEGSVDARPERHSTVIVVAGGDPVAVGDLPRVPEGALVIAADSGVDLALALGLRVDVAVGDFDSVRPSSLQAVADAGGSLERHPEAKDATDLELALDAALVRGARQVLVIGGHGGRLDHFLANAALLASPAYAELDLVAQMGPARVTVVRTGSGLYGAPGDLVTLVPVHGPARGVTTSGLLYPLHHADLAPGSTRGVSNQLVGTEATVTLDHGVLLAVQPGQPGPSTDQLPTPGADRRAPEPQRGTST